MYISRRTGAIVMETEGSGRYFTGFSLIGCGSSLRFLIGEPIEGEGSANAEAPVCALSALFFQVSTKIIVDVSFF